MLARANCSRRFRPFRRAGARPGSHAEPKVWPGAPHGFQFVHGFVPEARRSLDEAAAFLRGASADGALRHERNARRADRRRRVFRHRRGLPSGCAPLGALRPRRGRAAIGGTWDLFRYPGVRSDSDMFTLGYAFRPWTEPKAIADGPRSWPTCARPRRARHRPAHPLRPKVISASGRPKAQWTVEAGSAATASATPRASFHVHRLLRYGRGHLRIPRAWSFGGRLVHPQQWPEDLDYAGKQVVVIGSGATAVTLVPELAEDGGARHHAAALADLDGARPSTTRSPTSCATRCPPACLRHAVAMCCVMLSTACGNIRTRPSSG